MAARIIIENTITMLFGTLNDLSIKKSDYGQDLLL
jgi:hypothetical protein